MRVALIALLAIVCSIPFSGFTQTFAEKSEIPDWVKTTLSLWTKGEITNEEFVRAVEYLSQRGIIDISVESDEKIKREIEYLKAKSEVFKEETKQLREENKELRILAKSQEIMKAGKIPTTMTEMFEEYDALQNEIKTLRETNKQFSKQIDSWITNNGIPEQPISSKSKTSNQLDQIQSNHANQINSLKIENKQQLEKIVGLEEQIKQYQNNIEILKIENYDKAELISILKERNQENRDSVNNMIQSKESYENIIAQIKNENFIQKQRISEYENKITTLENIFKLKYSETANNQKTIEELEEENKGFSKIIENLEGLNAEQKSKLVSSSIELEKTNKVIDSLQTQIQDYESTIKKTAGESILLRGKITQLQDERVQFQHRISQLEQENIEQRKTLVGIMNDSHETSQVASSLNNRLTEVQGIIDNLEQENEEYRETIKGLENENIQKNTSLILMKNTIDDLNNSVANLNSKIENYENTISVLDEKNKQLHNEITTIQKENNSENDSIIRQLQKEKSEQQKIIASMKIEKEESNNLINTLNSEITLYKKQIQVFEDENSKFKNEIIEMRLNGKYQEDLNEKQFKTESENSQIIKLLTDENTRYQKEIEQLRKERSVLENTINSAEQKNTDNIIKISEIQSENTKMKKQVEMLQSKIKQKHEQINMLKERNEKDQVKSIQDTHINKPDTNTDELSKENDRLLVELNYLKAKSLINDEEIDTLRGENEEYRILLNLLKKGQKSVTGIENVDLDTINEKEGVIIYKTSKTEKSLPDDWIRKADNSKKYKVYVEPTPNWSKDFSLEMKEALEFWSNTANVEFELVTSPSLETVTISWEKEMKNEYDGYVVNQKDVTVSLGSNNCDGKWRPYNSESIQNILIHEIGHVVGLEHAIDKSNIMYPMIDDAKFEIINEQHTIPQGKSVFIKGCSFSSDPNYKYNVEVADSKKVDIFFVPSIEEKSKVDSGEAFDYYSDIDCIGIDKSSKSGVCKVADSAGILIVNSKNPENVSVNIFLEEQ